MTPGLTDYMDYNAGTRSVRPGDVVEWEDVVLEGEAAEESILRYLGREFDGGEA